MIDLTDGEIINSYIQYMKKKKIRDTNVQQKNYFLNAILYTTRVNSATCKQKKKKHHLKNAFLAQIFRC